MAGVSSLAKLFRRASDHSNPDQRPCIGASGSYDGPYVDLRQGLASSDCKPGLRPDPDHPHSTAHDSPNRQSNELALNIASVPSLKSCWSASFVGCDDGTLWGIGLGPPLFFATRGYSPSGWRFQPDSFLQQSQDVIRDTAETDRWGAGRGDDRECREYA
jgi:hypothetical protein